jgi:hypothetical protein
MATFWLALAKVGHGVPSSMMVATMALARAQALVKSMVVARSVPNTGSCLDVAWSSGHRGLLARRQAHHGVELPTARC